MSKKLNVAVIGLGTVGTGVLKILASHTSSLLQSSNCDINCKYISARDRNKDRGISLQDYVWVDNPLQIAGYQDVDLIVELIGGEDGLAYELCKTALLNGKHVVTANKAMIARHGYELAKLAEENKVILGFEAAVAGGIPILKILREGLSANNFNSIVGILNGTCNYILTEMEKTEKDFLSILKEAQAKGFAEQEPSLDVDGLDAGHKICILSAIAFAGKPDMDNTYVEGIRKITVTDINYANKFGYKIKLLGVCSKSETHVEQQVKPFLISKDTNLATIDGSFNAIAIKANNVGETLYVGRGAGELPTASSVVADIVDVASERYVYSFGRSYRNLQEHKIQISDQDLTRFYIRLALKEEKGELALVTKVLADNNLSIDLINQDISTDKQVNCAIITHATSQHCIKKANIDLASISDDLLVIQVL